MFINIEDMAFAKASNNEICINRHFRHTINYVCIKINTSLSIQKTEDITKKGEHQKLATIQSKTIRKDCFNLAN